MAETKEENFLRDFLSGAYSTVDKYLAGGFLPGGAESLLERIGIEEEKPPTELETDSQSGNDRLNPLDAANYSSMPEAGRFPIPSVSDTTADTSKAAPSRQANEAANRQFQQQLLAEVIRTSSPEFLDQQAARNLRLYEQKLQLAEAAALAKSREKSQRELELENIRSWKEIEKAQIMRDTLMATQLAQTAYIAGTPNAGVLSALAPSVQQTMAAFKGGQSVFPGGR